jgi:hypothetical protein
MTRKLIARKHVHVPPRRNAVPTESHNDGQRVGYFLRTLQIVLLVLGHSEPPIFVRTPRLLQRNSYLWRVHVIIYEWPTAHHIRRICQVIEASTPRWTFEGGYTRSFGCSATWSGWTNGAFVVVTPYFSKRIEFYKFIYLNKYLIVAFHADA